MILIVGGQGSGKRAYAQELGYREQDIAPGVLDHRPVVAELQVLLKERTTVDDALFQALLHKDVILCNEVGCGIVPLDAQERAWRELVGRTCTRLATQAQRVVRMCCGIPLCLKDTDSQKK